MKLLAATGAVLVLLAGCSRQSGLAPAGDPAAGGAPDGSPAAAPGVAMVELFSSESCSSCRLADYAQDPSSMRILGGTATP